MHVATVCLCALLSKCTYTYMTVFHVRVCMPVEAGSQPCILFHLVFEIGTLTSPEVAKRAKPVSESQVSSCLCPQTWDCRGTLHFLAFT